MNIYVEERARPRNSVFLSHASARFYGVAPFIYARTPATHPNRIVSNGELDVIFFSHRVRVQRATQPPSGHNAID